MVARLLWLGLDKTKPDRCEDYEEISTAWTAGPAKVPGIDRPGNLAALALEQQKHNGFAYWVVVSPVNTYGY
jgi:hypothetical protein